MFFHLGLFFFFVSAHLLPSKGSSLRCSPDGGIIYFLCFIKSGLHQHVLPLKISFNNDLFCVFKAIHLKRTKAYLNQVNLGEAANSRKQWTVNYCCFHFSLTWFTIDTFKSKRFSDKIIYLFSYPHYLSFLLFSILVNVL